MSKLFMDTLIKTPSLSGYEGEIAKEITNELKSYADEVFIDRFNNAYAIKKGGDLKVMIEAHHDQIGLQVQGFTENGFIHVIPVGGTDKKVLPGSIVEVQAKDGSWITGVIGKKPIHTESSDERSRVDKIETLLVDIGATNKEDVMSKINLGALVIFDRKSYSNNFGTNMVMGPGLDDKACVHIIMEAFKRVNNKNITLTMVSTSQEETGCRGSGVAARRINPNISISLDVDFCTEPELGVKKEVYGEVALGKGPIIMHGSDKSPRIATALKEIAKKNEIPYQEVVSGPYGTNTSRIQESAFDCETYLISLPLRNMHTQVEICSWDDIENATKLLVEYLNSL